MNGFLFFAFFISNFVFFQYDDTELVIKNTRSIQAKPVQLETPDFRRRKGRSKSAKIVKKVYLHD